MINPSFASNTGLFRFNSKVPLMQANGVGNRRFYTIAVAGLKILWLTANIASVVFSYTLIDVAHRSNKVWLIRFEPLVDLPIAFSLIYVGYRILFAPHWHSIVLSMFFVGSFYLVYSESSSVFVDGKRIWMMFSPLALIGGSWFNSSFLIGYFFWYYLGIHLDRLLREQMPN